MRVDEHLYLAKLEGSARQVNWASDVRENLARDYIRYGESLATVECNNLKDKFENVSSASWWIDRKSDDLDALLVAAKPQE